MAAYPWLETKWLYEATEWFLFLPGYLGGLLRVVHQNLGTSTIFNNWLVAGGMAIG